MKLTVRNNGIIWYIYIDGCRYYKRFNSLDEVYLSEDYKHFKRLIDEKKTN